MKRRADYVGEANLFLLTFRSPNPCDKPNVRNGRSGNVENEEPDPRRNLGGGEGVDVEAGEGKGRNRSKIKTKGKGGESLGSGPEGQNQLRVGVTPRA